MGNIGFSQGLGDLVSSFERDSDLNPAVRFVITGTGMAADEVRAEICTDRVVMPGLVSSEELEKELLHANLALVSQEHGGEEFNIPSKLMNFMAYGLPIVASVDPRSEVARIVEASSGGWVVDNSDPATFARALQEIASSGDEIPRRAAAAREYAAKNFSVQAFAQSFDQVLGQVAGTR
jgi:colanic acid biosynthesis glycosyl transferase WcaI